MATNEEKLAKLKELVGDSAVVQAFLLESEATEKEAEANGHTFKETATVPAPPAAKPAIDLNAMLASVQGLADQLKELKAEVDEVQAEMDKEDEEEGEEDEAAAMPPAKKAKAAKKEAGAGAGVGEELSKEELEKLALGDLTVKEFAGLMYDSLTTSLPHLATNKEAGLAETFKEYAATQQAAITELRDSLAETTKELGLIKEVLSVLADIQPKSTVRGYQASRATNNIVPGTGTGPNGTAFKQADAPDINGFLKELTQG